jgi:hypothetical protein
MLMFGRRSSPDLLRACAWCDRIDVGGHWLEPDAAIRQLRTYEWSAPPAFTHGVCESCLATLLQKRELARSHDVVLPDPDQWAYTMASTATDSGAGDTVLQLQGTGKALR